MLISAVSNFIKNNKFNGSISIIISADEETTAMDVQQYEILKKKGEKINFSIVGEPSSNKSVGDEIRIGRRGS